jgi:DNA-binding transcriptional ArsR family regulator
MTLLNNDIFGNLDRLRRPTAPPVPAELKPTVTPASTKAKPKKITGEFLKGPIPLPWLTAASMLAGKAPLAVGLAVWFEAGRRKLSEVKLTTAILKRFGVNRKAKYRALKSLEKAGLVRVRREPRRNPVVTILDLQGQPGAEPSSQGFPGVTLAAPEQQRTSDDNRFGGT